MRMRARRGPAPSGGGGERFGSGDAMPAARAAEFAALYLGLPLVLALALPAAWMWSVLFAATALALGLLAITPGFAWSELRRGWGELEWGHVAAVAGLTALVAGLLVWWLVPGRAFALPRFAPRLWLTILALYPFLSALPQELVFRTLFFRRYGALFPARWMAVAANGLLFGLAHLMFWNWVAVAMTVAGGLIFAHGYLGRGGFAMAVVLHAVCGWIIFTSGLGSFFYHGAVPGR